MPLRGDAIIVLVVQDSVLLGGGELVSIFIPLKEVIARNDARRHSNVLIDCKGNKQNVSVHAREGLDFVHASSPRRLLEERNEGVIHKRQLLNLRGIEEGPVRVTFGISVNSSSSLRGNAAMLLHRPDSHFECISLQKHVIIDQCRVVDAGRNWDEMAHKREAVPVGQPDVIEANVVIQALRWNDLSTQGDVVHVLDKHDHFRNQCLIAQMRQYGMEVIPGKERQNHCSTGVQRLLCLGRRRDGTGRKGRNASDRVEKSVFNPICGI